MSPPAAIVPALGLLLPVSTAAQAQALGFPRATATQREFIDLLVSQAASPAWLTLLGLVVFQAYACWRRVVLAEGALVATLCFWTVVGPATVDLWTFSTPGATPLLVALGVQLIFARWRPASWRYFVVILLGVLAASVILKDQGFLSFYGALPVHILIAGAMVLGGVFQDRFATWLFRLSSSSGRLRPGPGSWCWDSSHGSSHCPRSRTWSLAS